MASPSSTPEPDPTTEPAPSAEDAAREKFRLALEAKKSSSQQGRGGPGSSSGGAGHTSGAASHNRQFRRKSGG